MKKIVVVLGVILLFLLTIVNVSAITGKIGNGKMVISSDVGETVSRTIRVINDNNVAINITIIPSGDLEDDIYIEDESFVLQPNEEKNAKFEVDITKAGTSKINVKFTPLNGEPGVVLSAQLTVNTNGWEGDETSDSNIITGDVAGSDNSDNQNRLRNTFLVIMGVLTIILLIILIVLLKNPKSEKEQEINKQNNVNKIKDEVKKWLKK